MIEFFDLKTKNTRKIVKIFIFLALILFNQSAESSENRFFSRCLSLMNQPIFLAFGLCITINFLLKAEQLFLGNNFQDNSNSIETRELLGSPIVLFANKTKSLNELKLVKNRAIVLLSQVSVKTKNDFFKWMFFYNKKYYLNNEKIPFSDYIELLDATLESGVDPNQHKNLIIPYITDCEIGDSDVEIANEREKELLLFLKHGFFVSNGLSEQIKNGLNALFEKSYALESACLNIIEKTEISDKEIKPSLKILFNQCGRPLLWLQALVKHHKLTDSWQTNRLLLEGVEQFFDCAISEDSKMKSQFYIEDLVEAMTLIQQMVANPLIFARNKELFANTTGRIITRVIKGGYYQDCEKYNYFRPLLFHAMNKNNVVLPTLTDSDSVEGTIFDMLGRYVFDKEIFQLIMNIHTVEQLREITLIKKQDKLLPSESITCFDIAKTSLDEDTQVSFAVLEAKTKI